MRRFYIAGWKSIFFGDEVKTIERVDRPEWLDSLPYLRQQNSYKVNPDTILKRFPLFCPKCGTEHIVDVQGQNIILSEPDAKTQSR